MKNPYRHIAIALLCGTVWGCSDFLEQKSKDLVIPVKISQYKEILQGDGYFKSLASNYDFIMSMTDDIEYYDCTYAGISYSGTPTSAISSYEFCYKWADEIEAGPFKDNCFTYIYNQIMVANCCIKAANDPTLEGTEQEREVLLGQASLQRAFGYFMLANIYSKPYDASTPNELCVPLITDPTPKTGGYERATMQEIWKTITTDITTSLDCLKNKNINNKYEYSYPAALILASRIALFMDDMDKAITYGEEFRNLATGYALFDISDKTLGTASLIAATDRTVVNFLQIANTEIVLPFGGTSATNAYYTMFTGNGTAPAFFRPSKTGLINSYENGDNRRKYWFFVSDGTTEGYDLYLSYRYFTVLCDSPMKYDGSDNAVYKGQFALRSGEVYVTLAEAYARRNDSGDKDKAIAALNALRQKRFAAANYVAKVAGDFASQQTLIDFTLAERRRELCFEELHRWWDMRRLGMQEITHVWGQSGDVYKLQAGDNGFVLNFPLYERGINSLLVPNTRPVRTKQ